jgi:hypothetical protein
VSPTLQKLRYKPGMRVRVLGAPAGFEAELAAAKHRRAPLERDVARLRASIGPHGVLWVCYPKAKALGTDLNRDVVRGSVGRVGLRVVSLVAVDEVWSALRCKRVR